MSWQETGDWRKAEAQVPYGVHPGPDGSPLASQIDFLQERELSFLADTETPYAWLPWWRPLGVSWVQGMGGEHRHRHAADCLFWK